MAAASSAPGPSAGCHSGVASRSAGSPKPGTAEVHSASITRGAVRVTRATPRAVQRRGWPRRARHPARGDAPSRGDAAMVHGVSLWCRKPLRGQSQARNGRGAFGIHHAERCSSDASDTARRPTSGMAAARSAPGPRRCPGPRRRRHGDASRAAHRSTPETVAALFTTGEWGRRPVCH